MAVTELTPRPAQKEESRERFISKLGYYAVSHPLGFVGALIMLVFVSAALFADVITAYGPTTTNSAISLLPPGHGHPLGADAMGRDIYSRIVYGARISLAVGIGSTALGSFFGVVLGLNYLPNGSPVADDGSGVLATGKASGKAGFNNGGNSEFVLRAQFQLLL